MNLQTIKSIKGKIEYVLLPIDTYHALRREITAQLKNVHAQDGYEIFNPADYIDNPAALARIEAGITQADLAKLMGVTQAYISKIERQDKVTAKLMKKVHTALTCSRKMS